MLTVITTPARDLKHMLVNKGKALPFTVSPYSPTLLLHRFNLHREEPQCLCLVSLHQPAEQRSGHVLKRESITHLKEACAYRTALGLKGSQGLECSRDIVCKAPVDAMGWVAYVLITKEAWAGQTEGSRTEKQGPGCGSASAFGTAPSPPLEAASCRGGHAWFSPASRGGYLQT